MSRVRCEIASECACLCERGDPLIPSKSMTGGGGVEECVGVLRTRQDQEGENPRNEGGRQTETARDIFLYDRKISDKKKMTRKNDKKNFHPLAAWPDKLGLLISPPGLFKFSEGWGPGYTLVPNTNLAF